MEKYFLIITIISTFILSFFAINFYIKVSKSLNLINNPENFSALISNKKLPTSVGIVLVIIFICLMLFLKFYYPNYLISISRFEVFLISMLLLSLLSFIDDFKSLNPIYRFAFQLTIVLFSLTTLTTHVFEFIPLKLSIIVTIYFWIYYMNVNNFMDGIDGFEISHVIFASLSIAIITFLMDIDTIEKYISFGLLSISLPFLYFNKPPAKVLMGDSGSIFFGFIIGWLTLRLVSLDLWFVSLIIIMYPIMDVTITIIIKIFKGHKPWDRLFDYFFLQGVKNKKITHFKTFLLYNIHNLVSLVLVISCIFLEPWFMVLLSAINSSILILIFNKYKN